MSSFTLCPFGPRVYNVGFKTMFAVFNPFFYLFAKFCSVSDQCSSDFHKLFFFMLQYQIIVVLSLSLSLNTQNLLMFLLCIKRRERETLPDCQL